MIYFSLLWILFSVNCIISSDSCSHQLPQATEFNYGTKALIMQPFSRIFASIPKIQLDPERENGSILVEGDKNIINTLAISTLNNTLYIGPNAPSVKIASNANLKISVGIKNNVDLLLAGNAFYKFISPLKANVFSLDLFGQAQCELLCYLDEFEVRMSGSSKLICTGNACYYKISTFDEALIDTKRLQGELIYNVQKGKSRFTELTFVE